MMQAAFVAVQQLHKCLERLGHLDAQCVRILQLVVALEAAGRRPAARSGQLQVAVDPLRTSDGHRVAQHLSFQLVKQQPLLICGPRGFEAPLIREMLHDRQVMLCCREPYVPPYCRLLAQLAYPLLLRLPSQPPFTATRSFT